MSVFLFAFFCLGAFSIIFSTLKNRIGPSPSSAKVVNKICEVFPKLNSGDLVVDFGCGWGNLLFPLSSFFSHLEFVGIENSIVPYLFCSLRKLLSKRKNLSILWDDFESYDLKNTRVLLLYLCPYSMNRLEKKVLSQMPKGSFIISHTFAFNELKASKVIQTQDLFFSKIYIYELF